jgi:hypothetical protein
MAGVLSLQEVKTRLQDKKDYLACFILRNYVMQGLMADTGEDWCFDRLHNYMSPITDWIFYLFRHLREGHNTMHEVMHSPHTVESGPQNDDDRRLISLSIEEAAINWPADLFSINALRVPQFLVDVNMHNLR